MESPQHEKSSHQVAFNGGDDLHETRTMAQLKEDAHNATNKEKAMTLREGLRLYPKAIAWSMIISSCIIMEGYDGEFLDRAELLADFVVALLNNLYAFPQFRGKQTPKHEEKG
jgi:SP family general alpha glucoside:H+ symporter-like MFS transporter